MDTTIDTAALRDELISDVNAGATHLAELTSRHAKNRELSYRAILLKRAISRDDAGASHEHVEQGLAILDEFVADQVASSGRTGERRDVVVEAARQRSLAMEVPRLVAVQCEGLSKAFRRGDFALRDVSLSVACGEIVGIVGLNGNGKTTLFRLIVGELRPDAGRLRFPAMLPEGSRIRWSSVRSQISYVPQELPPWFGSLKSNLHYEAALHGIRGRDNEREVDFIVERMGLANELQKSWHELSGGYKLRFALARALVWKPKLLVLDEPLANLDFLTLQIVLKDLRHLTDSLRYPLGALVSSQHVHEIEEVSDKLLLLSRGQVKFFGGVETIGAERRVNRFELAGTMELEQLEQTLKGPDYYSIHYSGVAYVVTTAVTVTPQDVLQRLLEARIPITYFRDISRSAKGLLQDAASQ